MIRIIRKFIKKNFSSLYKKTYKLRTLIYKKIYSNKTKINLLDEFFEFSPGGSGNKKLVNENIFFNIKNLSNALNLLIDNKKEINDYQNLEYDLELSEKLKNLFKENGSDKHVHKYHLIYSHIFSKFNVKNLLEIGLGSQDNSFLSNMGDFGKPSGCLKTFSEILGIDSMIVGLDIDEKALINEGNISSFKFDQLSLDDVNKFSMQYNKFFDLVIDDGLHSNISVINSLFMCKTILKDGGILIIEDLFKEQLKFITVAFELYKEKFDYEVYNIENTYLIIAKKLFI